MHGRLKVRSTEDDGHKKKIQAAKVKVYREIMEKVRRKRLKEEYDEELLQATAIVLEKNPDVATLWNIRKECILQREKLLREECGRRNPSPTVQNESNANEAGNTAPTESVTEAVAITAKEEDNLGETSERVSSEAVDDNPLNAERTTALIQEMYEKDLAMTERCLLVNPKGYNIWHHRCWLLEHAPQTDWQHEVNLCNRYLKMDERNFHTWDYRRYVAQKANVPAENELDFCTEKIKTNFSNYSSWHYRSQLLPILYPYSGGESTSQRPMSEDKLKEELEMVLTAAFTDPNDSSAWFYQRWLLGSSRPPLTVCAFRANREKAVIGFSRPIRAEGLQIRLHDGRKSLDLTEWKCANYSHDSANHNIDTIFVINRQIDDEISNFSQIEIVQPHMKNFNLLLLNKYHDNVYYFQPDEVSTSAYTDDVISELKSQLESCQNLLEYEPDSKWTLLTCALLTRAIDSRLHYEQSLEYLRKLQKVDVLRENYYKDLMSRWMLHNTLVEWSRDKHLPSCLDLSHLQSLTSIIDPQYVCIADEVFLPAHLQTIPLKTFRNL